MNDDEISHNVTCAHLLVDTTQSYPVPDTLVFSGQAGERKRKEEKRRKKERGKVRKVRKVRSAIVREIYSIGATP